MTTLIQRQEACLARLHAHRTSEKRAAKNRAAAIRQFRTQLVIAGYGLIEINQQIKDVLDMYRLQCNAED